MKNNIITVFIHLFFITGTQAQIVKDENHPPLGLDSFAAKIDRQIKPQIIDARSADEFALNHIKGAINFNLQTEGYETMVLSLLNNEPVFIYSIGTGRSGQLAKDLRDKGFKEVFELKGGIANWIGGGKPYYTSAKKSVTLQDYKTILANNPLVLVDIGSRYCGACKKVKPILDSLRSENRNTIKIIEIDLEESPQLISELKTVDAFPYLILYKKAEVVLKRSGLSDLKNTLDLAIAKAK